MTSRVPRLQLNESTSSVQIEATQGPKTTTFYDYNDVLDHIGQAGRYQMRIFLLLCIPCVFTGPLILSYSFTGAVPSYRCLIANCENATSTDFEPEWLNNTIPWDAKDKFISQCRRYNETWADATQCQSGDADVTAMLSCDAWIYDKTNIHSSIVTDFDLTCDDEWKQTLTATLFMVAMLIGSVVIGRIADATGRKKTLVGLTFLLAVVSTASTFSSSYIMFTALRFASGLLAPGFFFVIFVWGVESVGPKYRIACGFVYHLSVSLSTVVLGIIAYFVRDWRHLQLFVSAPMFLLLPILWFIPESTRWLISKKRYEKATQLILKAAEMNRKLIPVHFTLQQQQEQQAYPTDKSEDIFGVLRSSVLCVRLIICSFSWIAANMGFFGLTFSASNLSGNFYLNFLLSMVAEVPSYLIGIFVMNRYGRRITLSGGLLLSGLACLITGLVPGDPPVIRMVFSLLGKFFISCVLATVYSYTSELFPDSSRTTVVGLCSMSGRIGAILAPELEQLGRNVSQTLPYIIFAGVDIIVGLLCLVLPETVQSPLPATIEDAEDLKKYSLKFSRCHKRSKSDPDKAVNHDNN